MATFTVTTAADRVDAGDGVLSLREAAQRANATAAADTIVFANALEGRTLTLTRGQLNLTNDVAVDGELRPDDSNLGDPGIDRPRARPSHARGHRARRPTA